MTPLSAPLQILVNELADVIETHADGTPYAKIDWTAFLAFLTQLITLIGPILLPLIGADTQKTNRK